MFEPDPSVVPPRLIDGAALGGISELSPPKALEVLRELSEGDAAADLRVNIQEQMRYFQEVMDETRKKSKRAMP